jgi:hypothetical protein
MRCSGPGTVVIFCGRIQERVWSDNMVCSMFYSLIDRIDTSSFTGFIDRYYWLSRTGDFAPKITINTLISCAVVGYLE